MSESAWAFAFMIAAIAWAVAVVRIAHICREAVRDWRKR